MKTLNRHQERIVIMTILYQSLLLDSDINFLLENNLEDIEKKSISFIVTRVIKALDNKDEYINKLKKYITENWDWERLGYIEQAILLYGACEIDLNEIDKAIVIDECINIAKTYCEDNAPSFINGVLDKLC